MIPAKDTESMIRLSASGPSPVTGSGNYAFHGVQPTIFLWRYMKYLNIVIIYV